MRVNINLCPAGSVYIYGVSVKFQNKSSVNESDIFTWSTNSTSEMANSPNYNQLFSSLEARHCMQNHLQMNKDCYNKNFI